ncbi:MAG: hypothetical protein ACKVQW_14700 [Pyrinomonadaceae bacterium]
MKGILFAGYRSMLMLIRFFIVSIFTLGSFLNVIAQSSNNPVNIALVINGKTVESDKLKLEIELGDKKLSPPIVRGQYSPNVADWPDNANGKICIRITYKKYVLDFMDLTKDHFQGAWKVIVSKPDSPSEDIPNPDIVDYIYSIEFYSGNSIGIVRSKIRYKSNENVLFAQNREIRVTSIEVDSKPISTNYNVYFSTGETELIETKRTKNGFIIPDVIDLTQNQTVVFAFKKYRLEFKDLKPRDFDGKWKIGVDLEPFDPELLETENPKNVEIIYFAELSFGGRGSKIVVRVDRQPELPIEPISKGEAYGLTPPLPKQPRGAPTVRGYSVVLRGEVKSVEVKKSSSSSVMLTVNLKMELVNDGPKPVIFLEVKPPELRGAALAKWPEDLSTSKSLALRYYGEAVDTSREWTDLRTALNQPSPPLGNVRVLMPRESWKFDDAVDIPLPTASGKSSFDKSESWETIKQLPFVWFGAICQVWSLNLEPKGTDRTKLVFGNRLQKRWNDIGLLWLNDIKSEPIALDLSSAIVKTRGE